LQHKHGNRKNSSKKTIFNWLSVAVQRQQWWHHLASHDSNSK